MPLGTRSLIAAALVCSLASPMQAQWEKMTPAERQELVSYRLTADNISKAAAASAKLEELSRNDPSVKGSMEKGEARSLFDAIAKMNGVPALRSAIESSGLTTKQFMLTIIELASTRAAVKLQAMGGNAAKAAAQMPTSPQNIEFYAAHQAELDPVADRIMHAGKDSSD